ncbi:hypothetical protein [Pseudomonas alkylphenolica]|uniref:Transmembrane protein n=1 Tax=Pseudomonas alkylphenolica TaxID=237609 RepID=A0A077FBM6_9PSED|nr:hypothetical protein [Pseudomonas alkylphenolica]AIL62085.1 hypothetical protein PSAKL28_28940 [Pseudomonas alkylphenolica]
MADEPATTEPKDAISDVSLKEAFDIYQKQSDNLHKLWTYFQAVSLAVLGYTVGAEKAHWFTSTYVLIFLSYLFFAVANQWIIVLSQKELKQFSDAVKLATKSSGPVGKKLVVRTVSPCCIRVFHSISIAVVLAAIAATWYVKCSASLECPKPPDTEQH